MTTLNISELATEIATAHSEGKAIENRPSNRDESFDLAAGYEVEQELAERRRADGHKTNGRKIGFTNKAVWPSLNLDTIVWGYMFDDTVHYASGNHFTLPIGNMVSPRIEPEIVFKLKSEVNLETASDPAKVLEAVEWMALGFEIVDCPYPNWQYRPADMIAAYGFHGALVIGDLYPLENLDQLAEEFANFKLKLLKNGDVAAEGSGKNVFDSPAICLGQLARIIAGQSNMDPLVGGEIITTGTITAAQPVAPGEEWAAITDGLNLPSISIKFVS